MRCTLKSLVVTFMAVAFCTFLAARPVVAAESKEGDFEYLYGNHYCPACNYSDLVDPQFHADISNKKAGAFARIYVCSAGCVDKIKKDIAKYYTEIYRTDKKTGKEKPALDLKNKTCPMSGEAIDGKTSIEYNGMIVHFCCADCTKSFVKAPEPGMRKLLPEAKEYKFPKKPEGQGNAHEGHTDHDGK